MKKDISDSLSGYNIDIEYDVLMSLYTSFKTGGPAQFLVTPKDEGALIAVLNLAKAEDIPLLILGGGTNLLVSDKGIPGIVVNMREGFAGMRLIDERTICASSGVKLSRLATFAMNNSLSGLEFAHGIPGTLGGGIYMNAGAYGGEMKDTAVYTRYIDRDFQVKEIYNSAHEFSYRKSVFCDNGGVIIESHLRLSPGEPFEIMTKMNEFKARRAEKQPLMFPSAGSTFKRPAGDFAGRLIEASGLKGYSVGGAQVSELHAGFIINRGGASSLDIYRLIRHVQQEVMAQHGVMLEPEIKLIGEF